jgi:hypothetical protein
MKNPPSGGFDPFFKFLRRERDLNSSPNPQQIQPFQVASDSRSSFALGHSVNDVANVNHLVGVAKKLLNNHGFRQQRVKKSFLYDFQKLSFCSMHISSDR